MRNSILMLLVAILTCASAYSQKEYKITNVDTLYSNLYLKDTDGTVEIAFATPDKERVKKHSTSTNGLYIFRSYELSESGTADSTSIAMVSRAGESNVISVSDYAKEKGFNRTKKYALAHDYKVLTIDGKGIVNDKPPYEIRVEDNWYKEGSDSKTAKHKLDALSGGDTEIWRRRASFHSRSQHPDKVLGVFGLQIKKDKTKKWNDLRQFKFVLFNDKGEILNESEQTYDRSYLPDNIGWVHNAAGEISGYFVGLSEAGGIGAYKKANENWTAKNKRVAILDLEGNVISSDIYEVPYEVKSFTNQELLVLSVIDRGDGKYQTIFNLPVMLKQKVKVGLLSFNKSGEDISSATTVSIEDIDKTETKEKAPKGESTPFKQFEFAIPLNDGGLMLVGSPDGGKVWFLKLDAGGGIVQWDERHFAQPFSSKRNSVLVKEEISGDRVLITSKVGNSYRSFSQYAIVDKANGTFDVLRTSEEVEYGNTARIGNKLVFFGVGDKDKKVILARVDEI